MTGDLDAGDWQPTVDASRPLVVEARRAGHEEEEDAVREMDGGHDPFGRGDFLAFMVSVAILAFGIWWVTPW